MTGGEIFIPKLPRIRIVELAKAICPRCKFKTAGIRPGEKLHETLVPSDDGISTYEFKDRFVTYPRIVAKREKVLGGKALSTDFPGYRSDLNTEWLSIPALKKMIADGESS
jgi:UDP-N-acetylglucosamine 4,6-dehydratase